MKKRYNNIWPNNNNIVKSTTGTDQNDYAIAARVPCMR